MMPEHISRDQGFFAEPSCKRRYVRQRRLPDVSLMPRLGGTGAWIGELLDGHIGPPRIQSPDAALVLIDDTGQTADKMLTPLATLLRSGRHAAVPRSGA